MSHQRFVALSMRHPHIYLFLNPFCFFIFVSLSISYARFGIALLLSSILFAPVHALLPVMVTFCLIHLTIHCSQKCLNTSGCKI